MKWAKPKTGSPHPTVPPRDREEPCSIQNDDDFNAPLSDDWTRGGTAIEDAVQSERDIDLLDVEEAERRLAEPNDRATPFKPSL